MQRLLFCLGICSTLSGCFQGFKQEEQNPFPLKLDVKSYMVLNYIPLRRGENLDHLLLLDKWAQAKVMASGAQGEAVLSLLDGRASLEEHPIDSSMKRLSVNIIFSFEFKNQPTYGKGKSYFRLSEDTDLMENDVPEIQTHIEKKLQSLDASLLSFMTTQFPLMIKPSESLTT